MRSRHSKDAAAVNRHHAHRCEFRERDESDASEGADAEGFELHDPGGNVIPLQLGEQQRNAGCFRYVKEVPAIEEGQVCASEIFACDGSEIGEAAHTEVPEMGKKVGKATVSDPGRERGIFSVACMMGR